MHPRSAGGARIVCQTLAAAVLVLQTVYRMYRRHTRQGGKHHACRAMDRSGQPHTLRRRSVKSKGGSNPRSFYFFTKLAAILQFGADFSSFDLFLFRFDTTPHGVRLKPSTLNRPHPYRAIVVASVLSAY